MKVELCRRFFFEAAHRNEKGTEKQRRLHGHSYQVELIVSGPVESDYGWLIDYAEIKQAFLPYYKMLDHSYLNDLPDMGAASLADVRQWILERLKAPLPQLANVRVRIVGDCAFRPVWLPEDAAVRLPERVRFTFEAAQALPQLPEAHPCRRLHGHSYRVEIATDHMNTLEGDALALYETLDHNYLNAIPGLEHATSERMAQWIWKWLDKRRTTPLMVMVQETEAARCTYYGE